MTTMQDRIAGVLVGLAAGDRIGGPLRMALCLSDSLISQRRFNENHVFETYSKWYYAAGFDTGPTSARVFKHVAQGLTIKDAVLQVHKQSKSMTAGCNPLHRAIVLALSNDIPDDDLAQIARLEAKLTHFHPLAGDISAANVILCRKLIRGVALESAINEIDTQNWLTRPLSNNGFAPDVFHAALHFTQESDSFETALGNSLGFAGADNYCPVVVGALAGAIYGEAKIPAKLMSHCKIIDEVYNVSQQFTSQWESNKR